ncbi:MAG: hypothetical protein AAB932_06410, partial [Patescibacteria group bacterium]
MSFFSSLNTTTWRTDYSGGKSPLKFFLFSSAPHWKAAAVAIVLSIIAAALSASGAYGFKMIANAALDIR